MDTLAAATVSLRMANWCRISTIPQLLIAKWQQYQQSLSLMIGPLLCAKLIVSCLAIFEIATHATQACIWHKSTIILAVEMMCATLTNLLSMCVLRTIHIQRINIISAVAGVEWFLLMTLHIHILTRIILLFYTFGFNFTRAKHIQAVCGSGYILNYFFIWLVFMTASLVNACWILGAYYNSDEQSGEQGNGQSNGVRTVTANTNINEAATCNDGENNDNDIEDLNHLDDVHETSSTRSIRGNECIICFGDMRLTDNRLAILACRHTFHGSCLQQWLAQQTDIECPVCRQPYDQLLE